MAAARPHSSVVGQGLACLGARGGLWRCLLVQPPTLGERRVFPLLLGVYRALGTRPRVWFPSHSQEGAVRSRNTGHALREGHDRSSAQSPSSASGPSSAPPQLSCLTRTPGRAPRPARSPHTTLPGRLVLGFHFIRRRPDLERLRACGHPSWRAQELRAEELWAMG